MLVEQVKAQLVRPPVLVGGAAARGGMGERALGFSAHGEFLWAMGFRLGRDRVGWDHHKHDRWIGKFELTEPSDSYCLSFAEKARTQLQQIARIQPTIAVLVE